MKTLQDKFNFDIPKYGSRVYTATRQGDDTYLVTWDGEDGGTPYTESAVQGHINTGVWQIVTESDDARDARLWRALIGCARIRPLGSAGLEGEVDTYGKPYNGYAHLGLELWTIFGKSLTAEQTERLNRENELGREWLTKYAEIAAKLRGGQHEPVTTFADTHVYAGRVFVDQLTGKRDVQLSAEGKQLQDMTRLYAKVPPKGDQ